MLSALQDGIGESLLFIFVGTDDLFGIAVKEKLKKKSEQFSMIFEDLYIKAVEVAGFMRTSLRQFPALNRFNHEVEMEILLFKQFLRELEGLELQDKVLSALAPLIMDHMAREECYYLTKLAQVHAAIPPPL